MSDILDVHAKAIATMRSGFKGHHTRFVLRGDEYMSNSFCHSSEVKTRIKLLLHGHVNVQISSSIVAIEPITLLHIALDANTISHAWKTAWEENEE